MKANSILLTKSQFARAWGRTPAAVSMALNRNQLKPTGKKIDISEPINDAFISKLKAKGSWDLSAINDKTQQKESNTLLPTSQPSQAEMNELYQLEIDIKKAELERKQSVTTLNRQKEARLNSELMPVGVGKDLLQFILNSVKGQYTNHADGFLQMLKQRYDIEHTEYVELKKNFDASLNEAFQDAIKEIYKGADQAAEEIANNAKRTEKR